MLLDWFSRHMRTYLKTAALVFLILYALDITVSVVRMVVEYGVHQKQLDIRKLEAMERRCV